MKRSESRILSTHVGSLPRPPELLASMSERARGKPFDQAVLEGRFVHERAFPESMKKT